jgi:hypothetical protein
MEIQMKGYASVLVAVLICSRLASPQSEPEIRDRLVGTWKLISTEYTMKDGSKHPYPDSGPNGKGFLMYTRDGYMCAVMANPDRPKWVDAAHPTTEEKLSAAENSFAYCGRFKIDPQKKQIIHLPEVSTSLPFGGTRQVRPFMFEDGRLVLSGMETEEPGAVRWKIVWERVR